MQITAAMVKDLRERTGAGMMECKKALTEADGNFEVAVENMRKSGLAKADKKAGRVAADGAVGIQLSDDHQQAVIAEVNCETDFVAKGDDFQQFVEDVCNRVLATHATDLEALNQTAVKQDDDKTIETYRQELVARIGENIQIRRFERFETEGVIGSYSHGGRIGAVVVLQGGDQALAKDIAMHVAASRPVCVSPDDMPQEQIDKEREILIAQAQDSGKPAEIIEKMVQGRLQKYLAEITLVGQPFVKDPDQTVGKLLKAADATVTAFTRYEVGEGIEKEESNFADEVMAQVKSAS